MWLPHLCHQFLDAAKIWEAKEQGVKLRLASAAFEFVANLVRFPFSKNLFFQKQAR